MLQIYKACIFSNIKITEPSSVEDAHRLWELEKQNMQETLKRQQFDMLKDSQWLEEKEQLLVG